LPFSAGAATDAEIERQIAVAEIIDAGFPDSGSAHWWHLADGIDDALGLEPPTARRKGPAQHFDPREVERLQLPARIRGVEQLEPIENRPTSLDLKPRSGTVVARICTDSSGENARV